MVLLNCSPLPFPFFSSRSCCQRCFSGEFPAGLHDGVGRVLQTAGCLLRADARAGSGPQPGLYPWAPRLLPSGSWVRRPCLGVGALLWVRAVKQRERFCGFSQKWEVAHGSLSCCFNVLFPWTGWRLFWERTGRLFVSPGVFAYSPQPGLWLWGVTGMMEPGWRDGTALARRAARDCVCRLCFFSCTPCAGTGAVRLPGRERPVPKESC